MTNSYQWRINQLECYPEKDGHQDVVFTCHWDRLASDGEGHDARIYGSQSVTLDAEAPFTPYADLTFDQVVGWLEEAMGAETLAAQVAALDQQIANQINPPVVVLPIPWAPQPAPPSA